MGLMDWIISRVGTIDPHTGERVRVRRHRIDDWNGTEDKVETKDPITGDWRETSGVPGSRRGGPY